MLNEDKRIKLQEFSDRLSSLAQYEETKEGYLIPKGFDLEGRRWGTVADIFHESIAEISIPRRLIDVAMKKDVGEDYPHVVHERLVQETGFNEFSLLAKSQGTLAVLGRSDDHVVVLRIAAHPNSRIGEVSMRDDVNRSNFQGLVQPLSEPINISDQMQVEVMPFGQTLRFHDDELGDYASEYRDFMKEITDGTCFESSVSEVLLMPDGEILALDPGEMRYKDEYWELGAKARTDFESLSVGLIKMRQESWDLPENLKWITPDGDLKQDHAFADVKHAVEEAQANAQHLSELDGETLDAQ